MRNWNDKVVKADFFNRYTGQRERKEFSPKEIVSQPIGHEPETIISACTKILSELVLIQEQTDERIASTLKSVKLETNPEDERQLDFWDLKS